CRRIYVLVRRFWEITPLLGALASTIYLYNRVAFSGSLSRYFTHSFPYLTKREFIMLLILVSFTVVLGVYPARILDGLHYSVSTLIYFYDYDITNTLLIPIVALPTMFDINILPAKDRAQFITGFTDGSFGFQLQKDNSKPKIIEHFDHYILLTQKQANYLLFKRAFNFISSKAHLIEVGFDEILAIKASINKDFSQEFSKNYPNIVPIEKLPIIPINITPGWFSGFTSGEGCFNVNVYKNISKAGFKTALRFKINQHVRDKALL
uniref:hypothetical protein n=1 Tax=Drechslerella dactyloides TaxID=74499 RepID=UPI0022FD80B7